MSDINQDDNKLNMDPQAYYEPPFDPAPIRKKAGNASASLILGVLSLFCAVTGIGALAGIILGIIGIVQGHESKRTDPTDGLAHAGFVLSIVGIVFCTLVFFLGLAIIGCFFEMADEYFNSYRYGRYYW